ncbi:MAG: hybrid sensor histidine kinase/response regulator [Planctomycetales bacterium 71-10]|nr:MAG: hybrid sensor histidine kinase/response regulator [Planctomycetales bacterium 71-10]
MSDATHEPVYFLMVDDREENLVAQEALLRRDGLVLLRARSGPDALELLLKHEVALALVDVQMPGMDGFELAELMRGSERTRRVPIIFLTAGGADQSRRFRGYGAGAVDFLNKPLEPDVLRSKVDVFFELARQRDELKAALAENARLLEESRRHAAVLREADRFKDEFLAMLAHELRNPLAVVSNAIQVWKRSDRPEHQGWAKQVIENQLTTLSRLIDDLLDVSRITHGKIRIKKQVLDPGAILNQAVEAVSPLIEERKHELTVDLGHGSARIDVDPTRLEQVVVNLLANAAKYSGDSSRIRLASRVEGDRLVVSVEDEGVGIAPEQLPRMFELFAQGERSIARSEGGLGIGLTLVKSLVELHGGTIDARSEGLGRGSTFTVRLPLADAPAAEAADAASRDRAAPARRLRVLVVDDNADTAWGLSRLLQLHGHDVAIAHDGPAAVASARESRPDAVLLDIGLPGMTGYEVARKIREEPGCRDARLIAVTGYAQDKDRARTREAGFDDHMAKPVDLDALLAKLEEPRP